jgi:hypothetical protein
MVKIPQLPSLFDVRDDKLLYRYLGDVRESITELCRMVEMLQRTSSASTSAAAAAAPDAGLLTVIQRALSARGSHPLPLDGLRGQPADAQIGGVLVASTLPRPEPYAAYTEALLLTGGKYERYYRSKDGIPTWVKQQPPDPANMAKTNVDNGFTALQTFNAGMDLNATSIVDVLNFTLAGYVEQLFSNAASMRVSFWAEEVTLSTVAATTDSVNDLPGFAFIGPVLRYIRQTISGGGVTTVSTGDPTTAGRFRGPDGNLAATNGAWCYAHWSGAVTTEATGFTQVSSAKLRTTCDATPTQGKVFYVVPYVQFTLPTS